MSEVISINVYKPQSSSKIIDNKTGILLSTVSLIKSGVYRHYKGNYYLVFFVSMDTETMQEMVVYQALYGDFRIWSRPLAMFLEDTEYQGVLQPRFVWVDDDKHVEKYV